MSADYRDPDKPPSKGLGRDFIETEVTLSANTPGPVPPYIKLGPTLGRVPGGLGSTRTPMEDYAESVSAHAARYAADGIAEFAGQLLDKGEDVNLRARVLDLAAKWASLGRSEDRADKRAAAYRVCAGELRGLALLPPAPTVEAAPISAEQRERFINGVRLARGVHVYDSPEQLSAGYRLPEQVIGPADLDTLTDCPACDGTGVEPEEQA